VAAKGTLQVPIVINTYGNTHPISPYIYGLAAAPTEILTDLRTTSNRWGGNPSTRYNWELGNAWNAGRDWFYRNGNYGYTGKSASDDFVKDTLSANAKVLLTVPTLGWVAKDDNNATCSFPKADGSCGDANGAGCDKQGEIADPNRANVPITPEWDARWLQHLTQNQGFDIKFIAMDNEPDIWGYTHYDVHPSCTTYDEIRDKYLEYATIARTVVPQSELLGPVSCGWYYYWNSAAGQTDKLKHGNQDFLPWFLSEVRRHDEQQGKRTLDVLDIHYYPDGLYNDQVDSDTAAKRLRSTRSLWDSTYKDESWINQPVYLIPRMQKIIQDTYPGTKLGITEWNWGAAGTMNGALAIADVLGIYGRESLYLANYWAYPTKGSPAYWAFRMYTNYDGQGSHFGDVSIPLTSGRSEFASGYASLEKSTGRLLVLFVNKDPTLTVDAALTIQGFQPDNAITIYRYSQQKLDGITMEQQSWSRTSHLLLPAYSITLAVINPMANGTKTAR
jgi:hypothetical protein